MSIAMKIKTTAKCIVPVLVLATLSGAAAAADVKRAPATMCRGISGGTLSYYATGALHNTSNYTDSSVICPIVWEDATGSGNIYATVYNNHSTLYLTCWAESFYANDYSYGDLSSNYLSPSTDWTSISLGYHSAPTNGYTVVRCSIPRKESSFAPSGIASYRVE